MKKEVSAYRGKIIYLLGKDAEGNKWYMPEFSWDCDWYWGGGYVQSYGKNWGHFHFKEFLNAYVVDNFRKFFVETPLTDNEIYQLADLMNSFYVARKFSDLIYRGNSNFTGSIDTDDILKDEVEYRKINKEIIPALAQKIYKLLDGKEV